MLIFFFSCSIFSHATFVYTFHYFDFSQVFFIIILNELVIILKIIAFELNILLFFFTFLDSICNIGPRFILRINKK